MGHTEPQAEVGHSAVGFSPELDDPSFPRSGICLKAQLCTEYFVLETISWCSLDFFQNNPLPQWDGTEGF